MGAWQETAIWRQIETGTDATSKVVQTMLANCMPTVEQILKSGGTSPADFTLHDENHSFRVAERMVEIIPSDVFPQLSPYEHALLLLSAYLHDIGMTPERRKVTDHYNYLLTADANELSRPEIDAFQEWLDNEGSGIEPPIKEGTVDAKTLGRANELITYYCRSKHNDWSKEWIDEHRNLFAQGMYPSFVDDLILICQSHHEGYARLASRDFDPHLVSGSGTGVVHRRYLAAVLRLADILEFDPERTPEVVLRHRDIAPSSIPYWHKDHEVHLIHEDDRFVASASPKTAAIHHAIEQMLNDIEKELRVCCDLAAETHFDKCPGLNKTLPHRWDLQGTLHRAGIVPRNNQYVYIDGAFRPDMQKILHLLAGTELYSSQYAAVRELLQNAFDAVREQLAYQRLHPNSPQDDEYADSLRNTLWVKLRLEKRGNDYWLICTDNGVGMTKDIIDKYLLVSGRAKRHNIIDLERRCEQAGFSLERTGQFGIGVLSYFMIADRLEIKTRRSLDAGSSEQTGWHFETNGISSFGELRRDNGVAHGTQISLCLNEEINDDIVDWFLGLHNYLQRTLQYLPCRLIIESDLWNAQLINHDAGWIDRSAHYTERIWARVFPERDYLHGEMILTKSKRDNLSYFEAQRKELKPIFHDAIRFEKFEGELPEGLGRYRILIAYYTLPGGISLNFMWTNEVSNHFFAKKFGGTRQLGFAPEYDYQESRVSWRGMYVPDIITEDSEYQDEVPDVLTEMLQQFGCNIFLELDFTSDEAGDLSVAREKIYLFDESLWLVDWLTESISDALSSFTKRHSASIYSLLNHRLSVLDVQKNADCWWIVQSNTSAEWRCLQFPIASPVKLFNFSRDGVFVWNNKRVMIPTQVGGWDWHGNIIIPDLLTRFVHEGRFYVVPLWNSWSHLSPECHVGARTCQFPPNWSDLLFVRFSPNRDGDSSDILWNPEHFLFSLTDEATIRWCDREFYEKDIFVHAKANPVKDCKQAVAWLLLAISQINRQDWLELANEHHELIEKTWELIFHKGKESALPIAWLEQPYHGELHIVTTSNHRVYSQGEGKEFWQRYMPRVSAKWRLELDKSEGDEDDN